MAISCSGLIILLGLCAAIATSTFGAMLYSFARFRRSPRSASNPLLRTNSLELLWALVPIVILTGIAVIALKFRVTHDCSVANLTSPSTWVG